MASSEPKPSTTLLEERFASGDPSFLDELARFNSPKYLATFADKWKKDPRPWAERQILDYLAGPLDHPGHEPIVKRLFKQAETSRNDKVMTAFMVAFDRLVRRRIRQKWQYNTQTRESWQEDVLLAPRDRVRPPVTTRNPRTGEEIRLPSRAPRGGGHLFSYRTRYYLRRRAWRYFRRMGYQRPDAYVQAISRALKLYQDPDVARGENVLDNWSLLQACFRHHDALQFHTSTVVIREGHGLGELQPAPRFPELWRKPAAFDPLLDLVSTAGSRLIRVWAMGLIRKEHAETLKQLEPDRLIPLLDHEDGEVQRFSAELMGGLTALQNLPIDTWLRLLQTKSPEAIALLCEAMTRNVTPERLTTEQCITLACATPVPVARLGFELLRRRSFVSTDDRLLLRRLADTRCSAVAAEMTVWALSILGATASYDREGMTGFFDASLTQTRGAAMDWLKAGSPGWDDPQLWARLVESPFDDVRLRLVDLLQARVTLPGVSGEQLAPLWCTVVLGVHRGGRQKQKVVQQLATEISRRPERAGQLVPVLAAAVRSIRTPERRSGLAAVASLIARQPELASLIAEALPELKWREPQGASL